MRRTLLPNTLHNVVKGEHFINNYNLLIYFVEPVFVLAWLASDHHRRDQIEVLK